MSTLRFSPDSWTDGAARLDDVAAEFAAAAQGVVGRLGDLSDVVPTAATSADAAVVQILQSLNAAASRTIDGLAAGLAVEADTMAVTGREYAAREDSNEALAARIGG
ncbi:MAG: hypothetical protein GX596_15020 [Propionibacterium sp.]|nr:hypothetical protein [Propionibacterium sp.]